MISKIFFILACATLILAFLPKNAEAAHFYLIENTETEGIVKATYDWDEGIVDKVNNRLYFEMHYFFQKIYLWGHRKVNGITIPYIKKTLYRIKSRPKKNSGSWLSSITSEVLEFDGVEYKIKVTDDKNGNVAYATFDTETNWLSKPGWNQRLPPEDIVGWCKGVGLFLGAFHGSFVGTAAGGAAAAMGAVGAGGALIIGFTAGAVAALTIGAAFMVACP